MIELTGWVLAAWTIGTALLCLASSWGSVKYQQKAFEKSLDNFAKGQKCLENRMSGMERTYMATTECKEKQKERDAQRDYHESHLIQKLDDLQSFMKDMDQRREKTKSDLKDQLADIRSDLKVLQSQLRNSIEYGPIIGTPKYDSPAG